MPLSVSVIPCSETERPLPDRLFAQLHVVGGGPGEVLEQVAERLRGDDPQVDRDPVVGLGPDPVRPGGAGGGDQRVRSQVLGQRRRLLGRRDQVDVLAGLGPAPGRAGDLDPVGAGVVAERRRELLGDGPHRREQDPPRPLAGLAQALHRRQHVFLDLRPEPFQVADPLGLGRLLQLVEGRDPELVEQAARGFGAETRDPRDLDQRRRELRLQLLRSRDLTGLDQGVDFPRQGVADAGDLGRPPGGGELGDRNRAFADRLRRRAVGEHPVFHGAVELVEHPQLFEGGGDLSVGHTRQNKRASGWPQGRRYTF